MAARLLTAALLSALLACAAACGGNPTTPTPVVITPPSSPPTIACPADVTASTLNGSPVAVSFDSPTVTGGTLPVTTTCSTGSGSTFPLGTTEVSCTAVDGQQRQASCAFGVTVVEAPHITKTRFLAFGDSITQGVASEACQYAPSGAFAVFDPFRVGPYAFAAKPYPFVLQQMLQARYPGELPTVVNSGLGGETAVKGDDRLSGELNALQPQALLLLEGVNDIHDAQHNAVFDVKGALASMVKHGRERGIVVFLSTLLPERSDGKGGMGGCKAYDWSDGANDIVDANAGIRVVAQQQGAILVDMYQAFVGQEATLLGPDGLHPSEAGYQKMADIFFDAINANLQ